MSTCFLIVIVGTLVPVIHRLTKSFEEDGRAGESCFFFSSRRRHTRCLSDWSSDVCSSDLVRCRVPGTAGYRDAGPDWSLADLGAQQRRPWRAASARLLLHSQSFRPARSLHPDRKSVV